MKHRLALLVLVPTFCLDAARAQGEVDARSTVAKGASVWIEHDSTLDAKVEFGGRQITTTENVVWTLHLQVDDVDKDGNYLVTTKVVRARGKLVMAAGQGEAEFDSAGEADGSGSPTARQAAKTIADAVGKSFACKVSARGQVIELGAGKAELVDDGQRGGAMHTRDEATLRQWVEGAFGTFPEKRTAGGARWNRTVGESMGRMPTRLQLASTLTNVDPEFFEIEASGTLDIDREAAVAMEKQRGGRSIGQIESTKVTSSKVEAKQKTSRRDGFVLAASRTIALEFESSDPGVGEMQASYTMKLSTARTTEAAAMQKPGGGKDDKKTPPDDKGK